jgi:hypothetical protein
MRNSIRLSSGTSATHAPLHINSTAHRIHYTVELSQRSISSILGDPSAMLSDLAIYVRAQVTLEPSVASSPWLVRRL